MLPRQHRGLGTEPPGVWALESYQDKHRGLGSEPPGMKIAAFSFWSWSMQLFQPIRSLWSWSMQLPNLSGLSIGFTRTVFSSFFWSRHNLRNGVFRESTILILNFWSQKYHSSSKNENFEKSQNLTKIWNFHFCLITLMVHNLFFWWQNIPGKRQKWSFQLEYLFL